MQIQGTRPLLNSRAQCQVLGRKLPIRCWRESVGKWTFSTGPWASPL